MKKNDNLKRSGFHSIESIIKNNPHKIKKLFLPSSRDDKRINNLIEMANKNDISFEISKKLKQDPEAIIAAEDNLNFKDFKKFLDTAFDKEVLILILDNIIDPRNLGACIRSAAVSGVDALVINKHHCAPLNEIAHNVSAGGAEVVKTFFISNLVNCLKHLNKLNISIFGLSEHANKEYTDCDFTNSSALIMGSEEFGIRKKTSENCDYLIKLSNNKNFKSFNVSVATGIILSEVSRQRKC
jgi:23S rRNA (guanosine2251-2'-O)-methyltransferase